MSTIQTEVLFYLMDVEEEDSILNNPEKFNFFFEGFHSAWKKCFFDFDFYQKNYMSMHWNGMEMYNILTNQPNYFSTKDDLVQLASKTLGINKTATSEFYGRYGITYTTADNVREGMVEGRHSNIIHPGSIIYYQYYEASLKNSFHTVVALYLGKDIWLGNHGLYSTEELFDFETTSIVGNVSFLPNMRKEVAEFWLGTKPLKLTREFKTIVREHEYINEFVTSGHIENGHIVVHKYPRDETLEVPTIHDATTIGITDIGISLVFLDKEYKNKDIQIVKTCTAPFRYRKPWFVKLDKEDLEKATKIIEDTYTGKILRGFTHYAGS